VANWEDVLESGSDLPKARGKIPGKFASVRIQDGEQVAEITEVQEFFEARIGVTGIVTPTTGVQTETSAASIVMFGKGKKHKVIWEAPSEP
jgi:hypothetical protein